MFLIIKEVNYEEFFINFDEIKLIEFLHLESEGEVEEKWWKLKVYLKEPKNLEENEDRDEVYILGKEQFFFIKEQIQKYNRYWEKD